MEVSKTSDSKEYRRKESISGSLKVQIWMSKGLNIDLKGKMLTNSYTVRCKYVIKCMQIRSEHINNTRSTCSAYLQHCVKQECKERMMEVNKA